MPCYVSLLYKVISNYDQISGAFLKNGKLSGRFINIDVIVFYRFIFTEVVGIPLGISRTAQLPALPRQLVILIVPLAGAQYRVAVFNLLAVDQAAKGVIGIQVGDCTARSFAFASLRAVFWVIV